MKLVSYYIPLSEESISGYTELYVLLIDAFGFCTFPVTCLALSTTPILHFINTAFT